MVKTSKHDILFGKHLETIRKIRKKSRQEIAAKLEVSQQQLQKYEKGENRVAVGRLYDLAKALDVGVQELIPPKLDETKPIFKGQVDSAAFYLWSKLKDNQKRSMISVMRELIK